MQNSRLFIRDTWKIWSRNRYKRLSLESYKRALIFAYENDLSVEVPFSNIGGESSNSKISIDKLRFKASNDLRILNESLSKLSNDSGDINFLDNNIDSNLIADFDFTNAKLAESRKIYKENDIAIKNLIEKRDSLIKTIKSKSREKLLREKFLFNNAINPVPAAPTAAPSVGVNHPR